jgi:hypothetical protein
MTTSTCTPISAPTQAPERELAPDRLAELLECLADLIVETGRQRRGITLPAETAAASSREAVRRLTELEDALRRVGLEAAAVHQLLQHEHLI